LINEVDPKNREHWVQIITTIPEISSTDHNDNQTTDKRITSIDFGYKNSLMLKPFRPLKLEKVQHLFDHVVDQGNKYGGKHVADFDFLNFKEINADGHDQYAADSGHLIDDIGN